MPATSEMFINALITSKDAYNDNTETQIPSGSGLQHITTITANNGFSASIYKNSSTDKYIVAYAGTKLTDVGDIASDAQMAAGKYPSQFQNAISLIEDTLPKDYSINPSDIEMITGHSLGGSLAQLVGQLDKYSDIPVIALNPYGTKDLEGNLPDGYEFSNDSSNIYNYMMPGDPISNLKGQVGNTTYLSPSLLQKITQDLPMRLCIMPGIGNIIAAFKLSSAIYSHLLESMTAASNMQAPVDPLIIDLDGDGIETVSLDEGVFFDQSSDGFAELSSWVDTDDGIIVHDKNNNYTKNVHHNILLNLA